MKKAALSCFIFLALFIFSSNLALGDGVAIPKAKVRPEVGKHVSLPSQKAAIAWDGETETLVLSTKIKGEDLQNIAWITPIPSETRPLVQKSDAGIFKDIGHLFSKIKIEYVGGKGPRGEVTLIFLIFLLLSLFFFVFGISRRENKKIMIPCLLLATIFFFAFFLFPAFFMGTMGTAGVKDRKGKVVPLKVVESKNVGIYDVLVLKANNSTYMVNWLEDRGYQVSDKSIPVLEDYCNRENFYFTVNRIDLEDLSDKRKTKIKKDFAEGSATPLKIRFQPDRPYYPMKMSSINTGETTINVYFFSDAPLRDESGFFRIKDSRHRERSKKILKVLEEMQISLPETYKKPVATWLQYKGNLGNLTRDSYFVTDSAACKKLPSRHSYKMEERGRVLLHRLGEAEVTGTTEAELRKYLREGEFVKVTKESCYESLIELAKERKDSSICDGIPEDIKDKCYKEVAVERGEYLLCNKIQENETRDKCYKEIAVNLGDFSLCKIVRGEEIKINCYVDIVKAKEKPSLCRKIENQITEDRCFKKIAKYKEEPSLCTEINTQIVRDSCYKEMAEKKRDITFCKKIQNQNVKDKCYKERACSRLSLSLCLKIQNRTIKDKCLDHVGRLEHNAKICEKIEERGIRDDCLGDVASYKYESGAAAAVCKKIQNQEIKDDCFKDAALKDNNLSLCKRIESQDSRYWCFSEIAVRVDNPKICENLQNQSIRKRCYERARDRI